MKSRNGAIEHHQILPSVQITLLRDTINTAAASLDKIPVFIQDTTNSLDEELLISDFL